MIYLFADTPIYFFGFTWKLMVSTIEFMILLLTECLNTSIEGLVDYVAKNKKFYLAKKSKDITSVAVSIELLNMGMVSYYSIETLKLLFSHQLMMFLKFHLLLTLYKFLKLKNY